MAGYVHRCGLAAAPRCGDNPLLQGPGLHPERHPEARGGVGLEGLRVHPCTRGTGESEGKAAIHDLALGAIT